MNDWKAWLAAGAIAVGGTGCYCGCVARGARVRTRSGERLIESLAVGDLVLSFDPRTGEPVEGAIVATQRFERETVLVRAAGAALAMTSDHPVYCPIEERYPPAGDWVLGERSMLWTLGPDGSVIHAEVDSFETFAGVREVFDITVDTPHHNFLAEGILVHNKGRPVDFCPGPDGGSVPCHELFDAGADSGPQLDGGPTNDAGARVDATPADGDL